jgi:nucleotide-binding universal stress UspA family protein
MRTSRKESDEKMRVLIAIDQSTFSSQIINTLTERKFSGRTDFKILSVLEPLPVEWDNQSSQAGSKLAQDLLKKRHSKALKILGEARQKLLQSFPNCNVHTELRRGDAREEIIGAAVDWMPDRVVLGEHKDSPNRFLSGAVSRTVARHSTCTVELIRLIEEKTTSLSSLAPLITTASGSRSYPR